MKEYMKPEVEIIEFHTEAIAETGTVSGGGVEWTSLG